MSCAVLWGRSLVKVHCWALHIRDCNNPHNLLQIKEFVFPELLLLSQYSKEVRKNMVILPKQIFFLITATASNQLLSACPDRQRTLLDGALQSPSSPRQASLQIHPVAMSSYLCFSPAAFPIQRSHKEQSGLLHTLKSPRLTRDHQTAAFYFYLLKAVTWISICFQTITINLDPGSGINLYCHQFD